MKLALEALENGVDGQTSIEMDEAINLLREELAEPTVKQSCVACEGNPQFPNSPCTLCGCVAEQPAQRQWQSLTDEEWQDLSDSYGMILFGRFKNEIETKLREKNT
jgi:hypothetical protein